MASGRPLPSSFDDNPEFFTETRWQKFSRKVKREPLIPLGAFLTCCALYGATKAMRKGDRERTNVMFRRRLYGQAFTLVAMVAGSIYWAEDNAKRKEYNSIVVEKEKAEKRDRWIKELEVRDEEEKAFQAQLERRRRGEREPVVERVNDKAEEARQEIKAISVKVLGNAEEQGKKGDEKMDQRRGVLQSVQDIVWGKN